MEFAHKKTNSVTDDRKTNFGKIFDAARFVDSVSKFGHVEKSQEMADLLVDVLSPVYLQDRITDQLRWAMRQIEFEMEDWNIARVEMMRKAGIFMDDMLLFWWINKLFW